MIVWSDYLIDYLKIMFYYLSFLFDHYLMIIWTIIRWLFVIIWEMIICDYLMIIWYWLFAIIWSKLFVIIWSLFAILLLRSLSVASGWVDERRSCRGICCLLPFSAATISLSFWACLYCEQQTIRSNGDSDTKSLEGLALALAAAPALLLIYLVPDRERQPAIGRNPPLSLWLVAEGLLWKFK